MPFTHSFTHFNPVKIHFNISYEDSIKYIAKLSHKRLLLLTSKGWSKRGAAAKILAILQEADKDVRLIDGIESNPQLQDLSTLKSRLNAEFQADAIIAFGGGSVIDSAKFLSLKADIDTKDGDLNIENVRGSSDIFAIPTLIGSGAELTQWATIWDKAQKKKYSLSHPHCFTKAAFYDVSLLESVPLDTHIYTALDSLSHAVESIWNKNANPISVMWARAAIEAILANLPLLAGHLASSPHLIDCKNFEVVITDEVTPTPKSLQNNQSRRANLRMRESDSESQADSVDSQNFADSKNTQSQADSKPYHIEPLRKGEISHRDSKAKSKDSRHIESAQDSINDIFRLKPQNNKRESSDIDVAQTHTGHLQLTQVRENLALAAIYAALAFSNTQTALAHAISYPLTLAYGIPHGLACSFSLPLLLERLEKQEDGEAQRAMQILRPYKSRIVGLFEALNISTNPRDYGLDKAFIESIFRSLNARAKNSLFDIESVKMRFLEECDR